MNHGIDWLGDEQVEELNAIVQGGNSGCGLANKTLRRGISNGGSIDTVAQPATLEAVPLEVQDREVIEAFLSHPDEDSYRALFRAVSPRVFRYLRLHGCDRSLAEDLTQDVMLAVYKQGAQLRNRELFRPWLFRIARNAWLQHLRHEKRRVHAIGIARMRETPARASADPLKAADLSRWVESLEPPDRDLVLLRYVEGLEYHEIASALNVPLGTVQWRVFQLKRKLAAHMSRPDA